MVSKYLHWIRDNTDLEFDAGPIEDLAEQGEVSSPGYPGYYPHYANGREEIVVKQGSRIKLSFTFMNIESSSNCKYDYVKVLDTDGSQLLKHCGTHLPDPVTSTGKRITVIFYSDEDTRGKGFHAEWISV